MYLSPIHVHACYELKALLLRGLEGAGECDARLIQLAGHLEIYENKLRLMDSLFGVKEEDASPWGLGRMRKLHSRKVHWLIFLPFSIPRRCYCFFRRGV